MSFFSKEFKLDPADIQVFYDVKKFRDNALAHNRRRQGGTPRNERDFATGLASIPKMLAILSAPEDLTSKTHALEVESVPSDIKKTLQDNFDSESQRADSPSAKSVHSKSFQFPQNITWLSQITENRTGSLTDKFVGRKNLMNKIENEVVARHKSSWLFFAPPGFGKSAIAASLFGRLKQPQWQQGQQTIYVAIHYILYNDSLTHEIINMGLSLAKQLSDSLNMPIFSQEEQPHLDSVNIAHWLSDVLKTFSSPERKFIFIVDGIDEAPDGTRSKIIAFLKTIAESGLVTPVILSRDIKEFDCDPDMTLSFTDEEQLKDIFDYVKRELATWRSEEIREQWSNAISKATDGQFIYAKYVVIGVLNDIYLNVEEIEQLPKKLKDLYKRTLDDLGKSHSDGTVFLDHIVPFLSTLLVSEGSVWLDVLVAILEQRGIDARYTQSVISKLRQWLRDYPDSPSHQIELCHKTLHDFLLLDEVISSELTKAHLEWAKYFIENLEEQDHYDQVVTHIQKGGSSDLLMELLGKTDYLKNIAIGKKLRPSHEDEEEEDRVCYPDETVDYFLHFWLPAIEHPIFGEYGGIPSLAGRGVDCSSLVLRFSLFDKLFRYLDKIPGSIINLAQINPRHCEDILPLMGKRQPEYLALRELGVINLPYSFEQTLLNPRPGQGLISGVDRSLRGTSELVTEIRNIEPVESESASAQFYQQYHQLSLLHNLVYAPDCIEYSALVRTITREVIGSIIGCINSDEDPILYKQFYHVHRGEMVLNSDIFQDYWYFVLKRWPDFFFEILTNFEQLSASGRIRTRRRSCDRKWNEYEALKVISWAVVCYLPKPELKDAIVRLSNIFPPSNAYDKIFSSGLDIFRYCFEVSDDELFETIDRLAPGFSDVARVQSSRMWSKLLEGERTDVDFVVLRDSLK
ncbi:MAG: ATP-binding protein [candidate division Zixibacteria bacterium]|nr:ATP-binding protein [candidate division Zixibacteria bacterium]